MSLCAMQVWDFGMQIKIRATVYADALISICLNVDCFIDVWALIPDCFAIRAHVILKNSHVISVHRGFKLLTLVS